MQVLHTVFYTIVGLHILMAYISELMAHISELISVRDTRRYDLCSNDSLLLAPCRGKTPTHSWQAIFPCSRPWILEQSSGLYQKHPIFKQVEEGHQDFYLQKLFNFCLILYFYFLVNIYFIFFFI